MVFEKIRVFYLFLRKGQAADFNCFDWFGRFATMAVLEATGGEVIASVIDPLPFFSIKI